MDRRPLVIAMYAGAALIAVLGYREFYFLTDDAFISFRYAANALEGRGLVWNPAPFLPVEGYTNFAWVVLLTAVWALTGIEPPAAANPLALACGLATLALIVRIGLRMRLPDEIERARLPLIALVLAGIVTNRTYLAWLSSGLETALFNLSLTAWVALALEPETTRHARTTALLAASAALAALTRPDGWLAVAGCAPLAVLGWRWRGRGRGRIGLRAALAWTPLALPLLHLLWRRSYYGNWLPNTYYAKHLAAWPESGVRYAASFVLEYGLWLWLAVALFWAVRAASSHAQRPSAQAGVVIAVLLAHLAYYTLRVGGDHFEYRVYSYTIPLLFVSLPWLLANAGAKPALVLAGLASFVVLSWPIPWAHHLATRELDLRSQTHELVVPVAPLLPAPFRWLAMPFDTLQAWLIPRHVGMRQREHAVFQRSLAEALPDRSEGSRIAWSERAVLLAGNVGLAGWVFPNVAVIDVLGLNDYVIARTPVPEGEQRKLAHDRVAPAEYLACYRPNFHVQLPGRYQLTPRTPPLSDADIAACERSWRERADDGIEARPGAEIWRQ